MTFNDCKALSGEGTDIVAACMQAEAAIRATLMQVDAAQKAADAQALAAFSVRPTTMNAVSSVYLTVTRVSGADEAQPGIGFSA